MKPNAIDPLYVILEQHLFNFRDPEMDRRTLVQTIVSDYLAYLRKMNISVPKSLEQPIVEELSDQVNTMIVKKIYGSLSLREYQHGLKTVIKKRARSRYSRLKSKSRRAKAG